MAPQMVLAKLCPQKIGWVLLFVIKGAENKRKRLGGDERRQRGVLVRWLTDELLTTGRSPGRWVSCSTTQWVWLRRISLLKYKSLWRCRASVAYQKTFKLSIKILSAKGRNVADYLPPLPMVAVDQSVDRLHVEGLLDGPHYPERLKLDRPADRPTFFQWSTCLCVLKKISSEV